MANPRKFSEKIALHNQKQAEETAAFEQIMREVIGATRQSSSSPSSSYPKNQHLHITPSVGAYRGGSLPNVNKIVDKSTIDLQAALNNLEEMKSGRDTNRLDRHYMSGNHNQRVSHMRQLNLDQKGMEQSQYSYSYLIPPDTQWRRTNSDSALHQSAMMYHEQNDGFNHHGINSIPRRSTVHDVDSTMIIDDSTIDSWDPGKSMDKVYLSASLPIDSRPKSCEVPGITIYPTQEDLNTVHHHIPISSNTGSLPDLTNLHFPAPLSTPIDIDDSAIQPQSPYGGPSSPYSPQSTQSNSNLSPPPPSHALHHHTGSGGVLLQPVSGNNGNNGVVINNSIANQRQSPGPSPSPTSSRRRHHHNLNNLVIGNPRHHHTGAPLSPQQQQVCYAQNSIRNNSSPPRITVEGITMDTSALTLDGNAQYGTSQEAQTFGFPSPQQYHGLHQSQNYVPPQSPMQQQMSVGLHRSSTPSDHSCSAPTSPVSHNMSPICSPGLPMLCKSPFTDNNYYNNSQQTNVLQHQLEQFRMVSDLQSDSADQYLMMPGNGAVNSSSSSTSSSTGALYMSANNTIPASPRGSMTGDAISADYSPQQSPQGLNNNNTNSFESQHQTSVFYTSASVSSQGSRSPLIQSPTLAYSKSVISSQNVYQQMSGSTQPQTPQTPTSIPSILLTAPNIDDSLMRVQDFAKDLGSAMASMSGSFDASELFSSPDESLPPGLEPIDFEGFQILPDIDSNSDETFRLERS